MTLLFLPRKTVKPGCFPVYRAGGKAGLRDEDGFREEEKIVESIVGWPYLF